jgi:hypothetical protein
MLSSYFTSVRPVARRPQENSQEQQQQQQQEQQQQKKKNTKLEKKKKKKEVSEAGPAPACETLLYFDRKNVLAKTTTRLQGFKQTKKPRHTLHENEPTPREETSGLAGSAAAINTDCEEKKDGEGGDVWDDVWDDAAAGEDGEDPSAMADDCISTEDSFDCSYGDSADSLSETSYGSPQPYTTMSSSGRRGSSGNQQRKSIQKYSSCIPLGLDEDED